MLKVFAPAKINLHLHITGKRSDGYHLLDSLVSFADTGDYLVFEKADGFHFGIEGEFSSFLSGNDIDYSVSSSNTVVRAARLLSQALVQELNLRITLHKNIPPGSGMGGGSADAAACLRGLCRFWDIPVNEELLHTLALTIGSDVPVCLKSLPRIMRGIGEIISDAPVLPEIPALIIWPNISVPTPSVFRHFSTLTYSDAALFSELYKDGVSLAQDLRATSNDLTFPATALYPVIRQALDVMENAEGCYFSRMSGSGSSLFGFFFNEDMARNACEEIRKAHPDWWVRSCCINGNFSL